MTGPIYREDHKIIVSGDLIEFRKLLSHIHIAIDKLGYDDIIIDMSEGIPIISSSFADEAFAKLFLEAGAVDFMQKFEFINAMETVTQLINKAINPSLPPKPLIWR